MVGADRPKRARFARALGSLAALGGGSTTTLGGNSEGLGGFDHSYPNGYSLAVYQIQQTDTFITWLSGLRDMRAKARIVARLEAVRLGNLGDTRSVGDRVSELRVDVGGGYRVYFTRRQRIVIVLLCGGDKTTQSRDIVRAKQMARAIE